jgi:hypothetical protein
MGQTFRFRPHDLELTTQNLTNIAAILPPTQSYSEGWPLHIQGAVLFANCDSKQLWQGLIANFPLIRLNSKQNLQLCGTHRKLGAEKSAV